MIDIGPQEDILIALGMVWSAALFLALAVYLYVKYN
jgi:hypothetical protein